jgi:hypothetical protein
MSDARGEVEQQRTDQPSADDRRPQRQQRRLGKQGRDADGQQNQAAEAGEHRSREEEPAAGRSPHRRFERDRPPDEVAQAADDEQDLTDHDHQRPALQCLPALHRFTLSREVRAA